MRRRIPQPKVVREADGSPIARVWDERRRMQKANFFSLRISVVQREKSSHNICRIKNIGGISLLKTYVKWSLMTIRIIYYVVNKRLHIVMRHDRMVKTDKLF